MGLTEYLGARRNENAEDRYRNRLSELAGPKEYLKRADRNEAILNALQEPFFAAQQRAGQSGADTMRRVLGADINQYGGSPELAASLGLQEVGNKSPLPEVIDPYYRKNAVLAPKGRKGREARESFGRGALRDLKEQAFHVGNPLYKYPFEGDLPFRDERRVDRQDEGWRARKGPATWRDDSEMSPEGVGFDPYAQRGKRITSRSMTNLGDFRLTPDAIGGAGSIAAAQRAGQSDAWRNFYQQAIAGALDEAGESQDAQLAAMGQQPWTQKPIGMSVWGPFMRDVLMKAAQYGMGGIGGGAQPGAGGATGAMGSFGGNTGGMDIGSLMKLGQSGGDQPPNQDLQDYYRYFPNLQ